MAVNKNFVVKNGLEVATDVILANATTKKVGIGSTTPEFTLDVRGGIGVTDIQVTGFSTFIQDVQVGTSGSVFYASNSTKNVGIGSTQPKFKLDVRGEIGATDIQVTGFSTFTKDVQVGASGSVFYVSNSTNNVGVGTSVPNAAYTLDVRSSVSTGQTALYVYGDMRVTGDLNLDDITLDDATIQDLRVTGFSTFVGFSTFNDYVFIQDGLNVTGIITATSFVGDGSNLTGIAPGLTGAIGVSSEGTFVGTGATIVDFKSSNGLNNVEISSGIATVTVQTGASIGLVIALGG